MAHPNRIKLWCPYLDKKSEVEAREQDARLHRNPFVSPARKSVSLSTASIFPALLLLFSIFLFFSVRRHEFYVSSWVLVRRASDWLLASGSLIGIVSLPLAILGWKRWNLIAAASLAVLSAGVVANCALFTEALGSAIGESGLASVVDLLTIAAYISWVAFSLTFLNGARPRRVRKYRSILLLAFLGLVAGAIVVALARLPQYGNPQAVSIAVIEPAAWFLPLARVAWLCLVLAVLPLLVCGVLILVRGNRSEFQGWVARAAMIAPLMILVGMLIQWQGAGYAELPARNFWPVLPASFACLLMAELQIASGRVGLNPRQLSVAMVVLSLSLMAVASWAWIRGPGLSNSPSFGVFQNSWRLTLRRLVPISIFGASVTTIVLALVSRRYRFRLVVSNRDLSEWRMAVTPLIVSLVIAVIGTSSYLFRIYWSFGTRPLLLSLSSESAVVALTAAIAGCLALCTIKAPLISAIKRRSSTG